MNIYILRTKKLYSDPDFHIFLSSRNGVEFASFLWMRRVKFAGCRLQVAGCRLQVAGCRLQVAGCMSNNNNNIEKTV